MVIRYQIVIDETGPGQGGFNIQFILQTPQDFVNFIEKFKPHAESLGYELILKPRSGAAIRARKGEKVRATIVTKR